MANLDGKNGRKKYFRTTPIFSNRDNKPSKIKESVSENAVFGAQNVKLKRTSGGFVKFAVGVFYISACCVE